MRIHALGLASALVLVAGACGSDASGPSPAGLAGTWDATRFAYVSASNQSVKVDVVPAGTAVTLQLLESGTFSLVATAAGSTVFSRAGSWSASTDVLTLNFTSGAGGNWQLDMKLNGNTLTLLGANAEYDFNSDGQPDDAHLDTAFTRRQ